MSLENLIKIQEIFPGGISGQGSILELGTKVKDNFKLYINNEKVADAKSVKLGEKIGAQIIEISSTEKRLKDLADIE